MSNNSLSLGREGLPTLGLAVLRIKGWTTSKKIGEGKE
jgi:hypothetical protein